MKILHITYGYLPSTQWGGIASVIETIANEQARAGHTVEVACANLVRRGIKQYPDSASGRHTANQGDVVCHHLDVRDIAAGSGTVGPTLITRPAWKHLLQLVKVADVVHIHGGRNTICIAGLLAAQRSKRAVVLQPHGGLGVIGHRQRIKRAIDIPLDRLANATSSAIVVLSESERALISKRLPDIPIRLFENPIRHLPHNDRDNTETPRIVFVGRLNWKKGADTLLDAFASSALSKEATLRFLGPDDGLLDSLKQSASEHGLAERVVFTGSLGPEELSSELSKATMTVHPARTDTFPMAILESIAMGVPTIVSTEVEAISLLDGLCVPANPNVKAIRDAIECVCADPASEETAHSAAQQARDRFMPNMIAQKYISLYKELLAP